ncbi:MAG: septation protein SepH, partial [Marmoricola sp.]
MQDLTPVGLSEDGTQLVLVSPAGEEFAVPVDARLRAALRGDNARLGQLETKMDSALRPRDIQARIRAGESPEDVAAAAQTTVEAIMPFAGPVIAERQHVAQSALKGSLRRRTGETTTAARTLGEAAELYFSEHSLHDEDVEWDAWRRPDGRWVLVAEYAVAGRPRTAEFTHDQPGRYVVAENDDARILTGELRPPEEAGTAPRAQARRLSPVPTQDELPLGDDAIELVRDRQLEAEPVTAPDPTADTADADWLAEPAPEPTP